MLYVLRMCGLFVHPRQIHHLHPHRLLLASGLSSAPMLNVLQWLPSIAILVDDEYEYE